MVEIHPPQRPNINDPGGRLVKPVENQVKAPLQAPDSAKLDIKTGDRRISEPNLPTPFQPEVQITKPVAVRAQEVILNYLRYFAAKTAAKDPETMEQIAQANLGHVNFREIADSYDRIMAVDQAGLKLTTSEDHRWRNNLIVAQLATKGLIPTINEIKARLEKEDSENKGDGKRD